MCVLVGLEKGAMKKSQIKIQKHSIIVIFIRCIYANKEEETKSEERERERKKETENKISVE